MLRDGVHLVPMRVSAPSSSAKEDKPADRSGEREAEFGPDGS